MRKRQKHSKLWSFAQQAVSFASIFFFLVILSSFSTIREKTVTFSSADGLKITADEYITDPQKPYIVLLHEQGSSRGEFKTIARRLCKLDYNCLAVDLRNGGNDNYVSNETTKRLRQKRLDAGFGDVEQDALAAIQYVRTKSELPMVLFGSGANGSLSLKIAVSESNVRAVVALSPGEYFLPEIKIQDAISSLEKPVFITSSKPELPYVSELASGINRDYVTLFEPTQGNGERGTGSFSADYENNTEYWIALILFFKNLM